MPYCKVCGDTYLVPKPSNNQKISDDAMSSTNATNYTKVKEISLPVPKYALSGKVRVKFTLASNDSDHIASALIYIDGIPVGTERKTNNTSGIEYSEDIVISPSNSKIQVYAKVEEGGLAKVSKFRIYCDALCLSCGYDDSQQKHTW